MKQLSKIGKIASLIFFLSLIGFVVGLRHCNNNSAKALGIQPLHASVDIPYISFDIDASRDTIIYIGTGTSLTFLAGTLVKKNGVPVVGKVQVKVREFHDAVSILRSGIPMRLQSDRNAFLQSSGMLEIRAFQNGEELEVASGKFINTELAAYRSSKDFQLYFLKDNNNWETRDTFITKPNLRKQSRLRDLFNSRAKKGVERGVNDIVFELYGDEDAAPELKPWTGQKWRIPKEKVTPAVEEAIRINWDSVKVIKLNEGKLIYKLAFWKTMYQSAENPEVTKQFLVEVTPFNEKLSKEEIALNMKNRFLKADTVQKEIADEIARLNKEADLLNAFRINKIGIWNIDRALKISEFIPVKAKFDFQPSLKKSQKVRLFCILKPDNSVVDFPNWQTEPIYLSKDRQMQIVAVLPTGYVAFVEFEQIRQRLSTGSTSFITQQKPLNDFITYLTD